jgi:hypothetical protein
MGNNALPDDAFIAGELGCDPVTPSRMRSKLKVEGFEFAKKDGIWRVVKRPTPPKIEPIAPEPEPVVHEPPPVPVQGVLELTADNSGPDIVAELREIKTLLSELLACWR